MAALPCRFVTILTRSALVAIFTALALSGDDRVVVDAGTGQSVAPFAHETQGLQSGAAGTGAGHIAFQGVLRIPDSYNPRLAPDHIVFHLDDAGGLAVQFAGADVYDLWIWNYYFPGNPPLGGDPDVVCAAALFPPGDPSNPSIYAAFVTSCPAPNTSPVLEEFPTGCPCTSQFAWAMAPLIRDNPAEDETGTWTAIIDYVDPQDILTPAVAQSDIFLMRAPNVVVVHGWESDCDAVETLRLNLLSELALTEESGSVKCFEYDSRKGVGYAGLSLSLWLRDDIFGFDDEDEIDIVAHSMGGLVARDALESYPNPAPAIGSISMLAVPNEGVFVAKLVSQICPANGWWIPGGVLCSVVDWAAARFADIDIHSQAIRDLSPQSDIILRLNENFILPPFPPIYRAHHGVKNTPIGKATSGREENDCFVSLDSVNGPNNVFAADLIVYPGRSHGTFGAIGSIVDCVEPTISSEPSVVANVVFDIKGNPAGEGAAPAGAAPPAQASGSPSLAFSTLNFVQQSSSATHQVPVPAGIGTMHFFVAWLAAEPVPALGFELRRPGGQPVAASDPDVLGALDVSGDQAFYVQSRGYAVQSPAAGAWEVTVTGISVPAEGTPYVIVAMPESQIEILLTYGDTFISAGEPQSVRAMLIDAGQGTPATSATASVRGLDGVEMTFALLDNGTGADQTAGDLVYSGTYAGTQQCGEYRVRVNVSGSTSEGAISRETLSSFMVHGIDDTVRDPCDPDEDNDTITDQTEENQFGTDPMSEDTDNDGVLDGVEVANGTDPRDPDTDSDGVGDLPDNCALVANPTQANFDTDGPVFSNGAGIGNGKGGGTLPEDGTTPNGDRLGDACDVDDDNDGVLDGPDAQPRGDITYDDDNDGNPAAGCVNGTDADGSDDGPSWDTVCDTDGSARDGVSAAFCMTLSTTLDADGDGLKQRSEVCKWGTSDSDTDSDGDGRSDCLEVIDVDGSGTKTFLGDQLAYAKAIQLAAAAYGKDGDFDFDGTNTLTFLSDLLPVARLIQLAIGSGGCNPVP